MSSVRIMVPMDAVIILFILEVLNKADEQC